MRARSSAVLRIAPIFALCVLANAVPAAAGVGGGSEQHTETRSLLGSYLAGRLARAQNDTPAAASYYGKALQQDPDNEVLVEHAFQMEASEGNWPSVEMLARKLVEAQSAHRTARAFLGLAAFKGGRYQEAEDHFNQASGHPIGELTSTLARAWIYQAQNKTQDALKLLDGQNLPDWAAYFLRYHRALIADIKANLNLNNPELQVKIDRPLASDLGVRVSDIAGATAPHNGHAGSPEPSIDQVLKDGQRIIAAGEPANYLIVGTDSREGLDPADPDSGGFLGDTGCNCTDTIMVLRLDPKEETATILSFPRDLFIPIAGTGKTNRINTAHAHGVQVLIDTIEENITKKSRSRCEVAQ